MKRELEGVEVNPGKMCNNRCIFCMSGYERDDHLPWAELGAMKSEILSYRSRGIKAIGFLGGEPTVYPQLRDCVAYARELGYERIAVCTNGMKLADRAFAESLIDAGVTRFTVSVHSHRSDIEEALVGVPGVLEKKLEALRHLVGFRRAGRLADNISINPVLCRLNMGELEAFARFFKALGIEDIRFNFIWPQARVRGDARVIPRYRDAVPRMLALLAVNERELGLRLSFGAVPFCVLPSFFLAKPGLAERFFEEEALDLERETSAAQPEGGFKRFDLRERDGDDARIKLPACKGCRWESRCLGPWESYVEMHGAGEFQAIA